MLRRMRPGDRGHRRAHGLEARPLQEDRAARRAARDRRLEHLGPVDHQAERSAARGDQAALLRHPLLQPAALHVPGGADQHADHASRRSSTSSRPSSPARSARAWCARKDTPNFIANRVGIAGMLATMKEVEKFGLTLRRGRRPHRQEAGPRELGHLPHRRRGGPGHDGPRRQDAAGQPRRETDPFYASFAHAAGAGRSCSSWATSGQKTRAGFYKKVGRDILRFDLASGDYVPGGEKADEVYGRMLKKPAAERLKLLRESTNPQAQFLWAILRDSFHYAAVHLADHRRDARATSTSRCAGASA